MTNLIGRFYKVLGSVMVALLFIFTALAVSAQESSIVFPVEELGNCGSKEECHSYCDDLSHVNECVAFAESHGLMDEQEAKSAREFARLGGKGPGGCTSKESCEAYCEDTKNIRQCVTFARQAQLMDEKELEEAEKVVQYIESGGAMPGNCRGERECRNYCEADGHMEECAEFAIKAGFMSEKEAEIFRKTGGKGPGGCVGRKCEAYCQDESNREQCVLFALEHNLMTQEQRQQMEEGKQKAKEAIEKAPPEVLSCIEQALGAEKIAQLKSGEGFSASFGEVLPRCFREVMGKDGRTGPFGNGASNDARECLIKIYGADFEERMQKGELDPAQRDDELRACMQEQFGNGFLNDEGSWERPQPGDAPYPSERDGMMRPEFRDQSGEGNQDQYRQEYRSQYDARRREMEAQMRARIEEQMRTGNFDPANLPPDFRPEGAFPPPESYNRPPESDGSVPTEYLERYEQYQGTPAPDGSVLPLPSDVILPPLQQTEPTSIKAGSFLANIIFVLNSLLGQY